MLNYYLRVLKKNIIAEIFQEVYTLQHGDPLFSNLKILKFSKTFIYKYS